MSPNETVPAGQQDPPPVNRPVLALRTPLVDVWNGDALDVLAQLPDASISACITDPPYGLNRLPTGKVTDTVARWVGGQRDYVPGGAGFMAAHWDRFVPPPALWDEVFRVLKPGGHLFCFAAPRTQDLMGLSVRLAGFELRDEILAWCFGGGIPKATDVSKLIDKAAGATRPSLGVDPSRARRLGTQGREYTTRSGWSMGGRSVDLTAPASPESATWEGWAAALKPAHEPILVARKPLDGTLANTVLEHGVGALHIDAVRIPFAADRDAADNQSSGVGRWPGNVLISHHPTCVPCDDVWVCHPAYPAAELDRQSADTRGRGTAARFFPSFHYAAKATVRERPVVDGVEHVSVKPLSVIRWLVDLVAGPGVVVLDPFAGSGTTAEACLQVGVASVMVEAHGPYIPLILHRVTRATGSTAPPGAA